MLFRSTAEAGGSLHYTLDITDGLRNGDTVTLTASSNREDFSDCIEKYGAIPAETEKTFTVSGLNEYVTTPALLTDTVLDSLKAQAEDTFKAYAANHWDTDSESLIGMDYVGDYILTPKEDSFWVDNDIVTLVYKINVHNRYQNFNDEVYEGDNSYYWYISFKNVSVDGSGNVASGLNSYDSAEERVTIDSGLQQFSFSDSTMNWYYYGYATIDDLYSAAVTRNVEKYNHQDNVNA